MKYKPVVVVLIVVGITLSAVIVFVRTLSTMHFMVGRTVYAINLHTFPFTEVVAKNMDASSVEVLYSNPDMPFIIKDENKIYLGIGCSNIPASGFDAKSFAVVGVGSGGHGVIVRDQNGTYISASTGVYGRDTEECDVRLPFRELDQ